jgi:Zn-dependent protease with chaperone function
MVLLFLLAVVAVVAAVDVVLGFVWLASARHHLALPYGASPTISGLLRSVPTPVYVWGALGTLGLIFVVSSVRVTRLAGGGEAVADMVNARRITPDTRAPLERRLLNVVEEMAIASGVRVPAVYVMDGEGGINAFAAGWEVSGAVFAVTRGTLESLTRDELQGVIGHEFSHILNGDMRINIRMIGVLAGIVFIGSIGQFLMRSVRRSRKGGGQIALAGLALFIVGYVGLFFARLIKAAVSREREYLADASSVQFTRNPDGLAGALDQIRVAASGALISGRYAEEMSHMFFGESISLGLGGLFATHPPLEERIRRIRPGFVPRRYREARPPVAPGTEEANAAKASVPPVVSGLAGARAGRSPAESALLVGALDPAKIDYAARLLASLAAPLRESLRSAEGAAAAVLALMLPAAQEERLRQAKLLQAAGFGALAARALAATEHTRSLGPAYSLPVIDLALPALKAAPEGIGKELLGAVQALVQADRRVTLHEFVVLSLLRDQLTEKSRPTASGNRKLGQLKREAATLLLLIARAGASGEAGVQAALRAGAGEMGFPEDELAQSLASARLTLDSSGAALAALKRLAPLQKALLMKGLFAAAGADGAIRIAEAELMRLTGAVLDCPLPPLLEEIDPAALAA